MAVTEEISKSWTRVATWLQLKAKRIYRSLAPGASDDQIASIEQRLGVTFPEDVRASLRIHNGAEESDLFPSSEPDDMAYSLLSLDEITEACSSMKRSDRWRDDWIPLATNGGGDYQALHVRSGEIVEVSHETGEVVVVAASWAARLSDLADGLETKRYKYDADSGIITPPDAFEDLRKAIRLIEEDATLPPLPHDPLSAPSEYAKAMNLVDPDGVQFGPATQRRQMAIRWFRGSQAYNFYFRYSEPKSVLDLNGVRFYPVPEVIAINEPHYQPDVSKEWPVVLATTVEGDHRLFLDTSHGAEYPPVVLIPADIELKGKTWKQLKSKWKVIAPTLLEFWRRLATGTLDLAPSLKK